MEQRISSTEFQWSWSRALELVELADVTLSCEGHCLLAHKLVLSACSPYFRGVFKENPCQHPIIILKNVLAKDITRLLAFMYQGEVQIQEAELSSFLQTAELLQVKGLTQHNIQEKKNIQKSTTTTVFTTKTNVQNSPKKLNSNNQQIIGKATSNKKRRNSGSEKICENLNTEITIKRSKQTKEKALTGKKSPITPEKKTENLEKQATDKENTENSATNPASKSTSQDDLPLPPISNVKSEIIDTDFEETDPESVDNNNSTENRPESPKSPKSLYENSMLARSLLSGIQAMKSDQLIASTSGKLKQPIQPQASASAHISEDITVKRELVSPEPDIPELEPEILISEQSESLISVQSPITSKSSGGPSQRSSNVTADAAGPSSQSNHAAICGDCPHCGTKYSNQSALKYHVRLMHSDLTNRLCCYLCPQTFTMRDIFKEHMWTSHGLRN